MTQPVMADGVGLSFSREATPGTQPTTGWRKLQVTAGGLTGWKRDNVVVGRNDLLSPNLTNETGEVVGYDSSPKLKLDVTKDFWDLFRELAFRSTTHQSGGSGTAQFFPTAVTNGSPSSWTVPAGGALPQYALVRYRNATNPANNGVYVVAAASGSTTVKTSTALVTEVPGATSVLEVVGVQAPSAADIQLDANGDIVSTTLDFTTLGLVSGQQIGVGDATSGAAFAFATARNGYATITGTITAHKIPLKWRSWTLTGADVAAGKMIRLLFHTSNYNVPIDPTAVNGYIAQPAGSFELSKPGSGGASTDYVYFNGEALADMKLTMPLEGKVTADLSFVGMTVSNPTASRSSGPDTALEAVGAGPHTTAAKLVDLRLMKKSDESVIAIDINAWEISYSNETKARKAQGYAGAIGHKFGKYMPMITISQAYITDSVANLAVNNYTDLCFVAIFKAADGTGFGLTFPLVKAKDGDEGFAAADGVTIKLTLEPARDPATGLLWVLTQFGYLP